MSQRYIFLKMASSKDLGDGDALRGSNNYATMLELKRLPSKRRSTSLHIGSDLLTPRHLDSDPRVKARRAFTFDGSCSPPTSNETHRQLAEVMHDDDEDKALIEYIDDHDAHMELQVEADGEDEAIPESEHDVDDGHCRLSKEVMFFVAAFIVLVTSGGLILGFGPIYSVLVQEDQWSELCTHNGLDGALATCPAQEIRMQFVYSTSFLCLSAANAFFGVFLDIVGPRWTAVLGLLMSIVGNFALAFGNSHTGHGGWIIAGYALLGAGGMGSYLAAFQILQLYEVQGFVCSTLSSLFNCSGYIYMLLQLHGLTRQTFFQVYGSIVVGCMVVCFLLFPTNNVTKPRDSLAIPAFRFEKPVMNAPKGIADGMRQELKRADLWYFSIYFGWISLIFAFAGGAIPSIITNLAASDPASTSLYVNYLYPLIVNGTFIYSPLVGYVIDRYGFKVIFIAGLVLVQLFVASLMVPSLHMQLVTFLIYAMAQACVYALQFAYIMVCYPTELYGTLQAFLALVAFSFGLLNYFLTPWTQVYLAGDYTIVLFLLGVPTFLLYFSLHVVQGCEDQTVIDEPERSKLLL